LIAQEPVSQISNETIQTAICSKSPEFWNQDDPSQRVRCQFDDVDLEGRAVSPQSGIRPIEVDTNVRQIAPGIWLKFDEHQLPSSREI
jgi:hypothetical protein